METNTRISEAAPRSLTPFASLREDMDRLFHNWLAAADLEPLRVWGNNGSFLPRIDVTEGEKELVVTAELPGVDAADVEVELARQALVLRGERKVETEETKHGYLRRERRFGSFYREIPLPWEVDPNTTAAKVTFTKGVLEITVPRPTEIASATRKLEIRS